MFEPDWTEPLPGNAKLLDAKLVDGRLRVEVEGARSQRAQTAVARRFEELGDVDVVPRLVQPRRCVGQREREEGRLQLRYVVRGGEHMSTIHVAEDGERVIVFGLMCVPETGCLDDRVTECPYHVYLDAPLGERTVIDGFTGEAVPYKNVFIDMQRRLDADALNTAPACTRRGSA